MRFELRQYAEFAYDLDGNMITNYNTVMTYDAQSRLSSVSTLVYTNNEWHAELLVSNRYDHIGRRVKKTTPDKEITYFYDGWNLIEERVAHTSGTYTTIRYYWGKDLSGTLHGAGGVGGLLFLTVSTSNIEPQTPNSSTPNLQLFIPCCDNNGNVTRYLDANGNTVAQYTFDAFGNTIGKSGPMCDFFRHRFSTKYLDIETGLYYYGYRFYSPSLMRWINRDPIEETGGMNLYQFCNNCPIFLFDFYGMVSIRCVVVKDTTWWEYFKSGGDRYKYVDIHHEREVPVVRLYSSTLNGLFEQRNGNTISISECDVKILLQIAVHRDCALIVARGVRYTYIPHVRRSFGAIAVSSRKKPTFWAVYAHEKGHARVFFGKTLPLFKKKVAMMKTGSRLTQAEIQQVRTLYDKSIKETEDDSANEADKATREWFLINGFRETRSNGKFIYE